MCPTADEAKSQFQHFSRTDGFNAFRIPVPWQSLINNDLDTNELDENFMTNYYDPILEACFATGSHCIIDIHNYARWNGAVIGQGGPADDVLAKTWSQLATRYKGQANAIFGIMNEPHNLDMPTWVNTVQASVTAIRQAGATEQIILLAGVEFANAGGFPSQSGPYLDSITNIDGTTKNLIFEVHQYLDSDTSGTHTDCTKPQVDTFNNLATYLRNADRQAFVGEIGGGNNQDCVNLISNALDVLNNNGDVFLGWTSWAAGTFPSTYELYEAPNSDGTDQLLVAQAFLPKWNAGKS